VLMKQEKNQFLDNLKHSIKSQNTLKTSIDFIFVLTLFVSVAIFFSIDEDKLFGIEGSCCFIFISLFRLFTFCPSILSSIFGVRFRRTLSVVDNFFNGLLVEPNKLNGGDVGIGLKSRISISGGFGISCCERF
jgi:hypothetical protein